MLRLVEPAPEVEAEILPTLDEIVREGARRMLLTALDGEVTSYIERHQGCGMSGPRPKVSGTGFTGSASAIGCRTALPSIQYAVDEAKLLPEEPDAVILHVRICGSPG